MSSSPATSAPHGSACELAVVIPVYNEADAVRPVLDAWCAALSASGIHHHLLVLDDGSTDATPRLLQELQLAHPGVSVIEKPNSGHGQTCIQGYRQALATSAEWVLQVDSDGQCDPGDLAVLWRARAAPAVLGRRVRRDDGRIRMLGSLLVRLAVRLTTGASVADANVPYRLVRREVLAAAVEGTPRDFVLANVLVAVILCRGLGRELRFVEIGFRQRLAGPAKTNTTRLAGRVVMMGWQLLRYRRHIARQAAAVRIARLGRQ